MIVQEKYNDKLTRTYSDLGMYIEREGVFYTDAIDPTELKRVYVETNVPIETEPEEQSI